MASLEITHSLLGDLFFLAYGQLKSGREDNSVPVEQRLAARDLRWQRQSAALGYLVNMWTYCVDRDEPSFCCSEDFVDSELGAGAFDLLVRHRFVVQSGSSHRWTGPQRQSRWLLPPPGQTSTTLTYVVQRGPNGPVKIGRARDIGRRLESLQTGCAETLNVLRRIDGDHERTLHEACAAHRLRGEWFAGTPEFFSDLEQAIEEL